MRDAAYSIAVVGDAIIGACAFLKGNQLAGFGWLLAAYYTYLYALAGRNRNNG